MIKIGGLVIKVGAALLGWSGGSMIAAAISQPAVTVYTGATMIFLAWLVLGRRSKGRHGTGRSRPVRMGGQHRHPASVVPPPLAANPPTRPLRRVS